ncbi:MAG: superoxide dismutase family protein [Planctomycetota bacterium]
MKRFFSTAALLTAIAFLPACGGSTSGDGHAHGEGDTHAHAEEHAEITHAICVLSATEGNSVTGWIKFEQTDAGVRVTAEVNGLTPGLHGFHVHHLGDISAPDGTATAGHFNPDGVDHGLPGEHGDHSHVGGHAGDLGNLDANEDGRATYDVTYSDLTLNGAKSIIGRSIIVHRDEDDGSQPTGNAGPRIAQGVIGIDAAD